MMSSLKIPKVLNSPSIYCTAVLLYSSLPEESRQFCQRQCCLSNWIPQVLIHRQDMDIKEVNNPNSSFKKIVFMCTVKIKGKYCCA